MKGQCSRCKKQLALENASSSVFRSGRGRCRLCENDHAKKRSRTLGGKFNLGSAQAKYNGHKWELNFQQYAAIVALDKWQKFRTQRDRTYKILCGLSSEELKKLRRDTSVREFLASLGRSETIANVDQEIKTPGAITHGVQTHLL